VQQEEHQCQSTWPEPPSRPRASKARLKEGGTARRAAIQRLWESLGIQMEAFYYAFGEDDIYVIFDAPDNVAAAASRYDG
jgi:uncharacterized protein with GYD domain